MTIKDELHRLINDLPEHEAQRLLHDLRGGGGDDLPQLLRDADVDDASEDELAALVETSDDRFISHDEIRREFAA